MTNIFLMSSTIFLILQVHSKREREMHHFLFFSNYFWSTQDWRKSHMLRLARPVKHGEFAKTSHGDASHASRNLGKGNDLEMVLKSYPNECSFENSLSKKNIWKNASKKDWGGGERSGDMEIPHKGCKSRHRIPHHWLCTWSFGQLVIVVAIKMLLWLWSQYQRGVIKMQEMIS